MESSPESRHDRRAVLTSPTARKFGREIRQHAGISVYLYLCFGALPFYKVAILKGQGVSYAPYGIAAIKALVLGKFILLGHMAGLGDRYKRCNAISVIAYKSLTFLFMLLVLTVVEELVVGLIHGETVAASLATFLGGSSLRLLATSVIMLLLLIPYIAFGELREALGDARLRQIMTEPHAGRRSGGNPKPIDEEAAPTQGQDASDPVLWPSTEKHRLRPMLDLPRGRMNNHVEFGILVGTTRAMYWSLDYPN